MKLPNILVACGLALTGLAAMAQEQFPSRPVRMVVGYAPGGGTDIFARVIAETLVVTRTYNFVTHPLPM